MRKIISSLTSLCLCMGTAFASSGIPISGSSTASKYGDQASISLKQLTVAGNYEVACQITNNSSTSINVGFDSQGILPAAYVSLNGKDCTQGALKVGNNAYKAKVYISDPGTTLSPTLLYNHAGCVGNATTCSFTVSNCVATFVTAK